MNKKWLYGLSGFILLVAVSLHFVPIKKETGFIFDADGKQTVSNLHGPISCQLILEEKRYRLIFGGASNFDKTKTEFAKYDSYKSQSVDLLCAPGIETTIKLYVF